MTGKKNILIIDDNAFAGKISIETLSLKLAKRLKAGDITIALSKQFSESGIGRTGAELCESYGRLMSLHLTANVSLFLYVYDVSASPAENAVIITRIINEQEINVLWTDREHVSLKIEGEYIVPDGVIGLSEELFSFDAIAEALAANDLEQIAIITYNPRLKDNEILEIRESIAGKLFAENGVLSEGMIKKVYFIETSPVFNTFEKEFLLPENTALGEVRLEAYALYGRLIGHILADLFFELPGFSLISGGLKTYSFFNSNNRKILRYLKFLNVLGETYTRKDLKDEDDEGFKVGMISFFTDVFNKENFLIDAPYKDYYEEYDKRIKERDLLTLFESGEKERYIYYRYFRERRRFIYDVHHNLGEGHEEKLGTYLPYLHTGIFYDPDFYLAPSTAEATEIPFKETEWPEKTVEIYYLFQRIDVGGISGILHFSMWRRATSTDPDFKKTVKNFWELQYRLIEPKAIEHLTPILLSEVSIQATRAAISQIMARNMSHNIASHVSYQATNTEIKKRLKSLYPELAGMPGLPDELVDWMDLMTDRLNKYEISRNEYLADYEQSPKNYHFYRDIILPFCENTLILDNIASSEQIQYKIDGVNQLQIHCRINKQPITVSYEGIRDFDLENNKGEYFVHYPAQFPYAFIPREENGKLEDLFNQKDFSGAGDVEVTLHSEQAFYSILENVIRNSAKHNKEACQQNGLKIFIDLDDFDDDFYCISIYDNVSQLTADILYNEDELQPGIYQRMRQGLIDSSGQIRKENWGYADMRINAFLFTHSADQLNDQLLRGSLELIIKNAAGKFQTVDGPIDIRGKINFGYRFKVCKPKKILWVGTFPGDEAAAKQLQRTGTDFIADLKTLGRLRIKGISAYKFSVINGLPVDEILFHKAFLPARLLVLDESIAKSIHFVACSPMDLFPDISDGTDSDSLLIKCYENWLVSRDGEINLFFHFENIQQLRIWNKDSSKGLLCQTTLSLVDHPLDANVLNIIYDHHGKAFGKSRSISCFSGFENLDFYFKHALVQLEKGSFDQHIIFNPPSEKQQQRLLALEIMDAALTNVFILDERIVKGSNLESSGFSETGFRLDGWPRAWRMLAAGKVFVINQLNGNIIGNGGLTNNNLELRCSPGHLNLSAPQINHIDVNTLRKDVIVIHRTYIDQKFTKMENDAFLSLLNKFFRTVIITSGGGYPHSFSRNVKFVPFSLIEKFVNFRLSKLRLNSLLQTITQRMN
jgi:hypothetical protein